MEGKGGRIKRWMYRSKGRVEGEMDGREGRKGDGPVSVNREGQEE